MDVLDGSVLALWLFSILAGGLIGLSEGLVVSGIVWPIILGPIGIIVVLYLVYRKQRAEEATQSSLLQQQNAFEDALQKLQKLQNPIPEARPVPEKLRISRNGQEIGELGIAAIWSMLNDGQLSQGDLYFDPEKKDWRTLACLPD